MTTTRQWLESLGLGRYAGAFEQNAVDLDQVASLTDDELKELGVTALGHRKRIRDNSPPSAALAATAPGRYTPRHLAERALASRLAMEGERKQVTVLFADIAGSTALIHDLDAEGVVERLGPAIEAMMSAVRRHEGLVNRVQGDGIMALFGAPIAHEDHAVRACLAALEIRDAIDALADDSLGVRVGLNSGQVVVRAICNDLTVEYEADGATVHLAARMEQLAKPGTVRTTEATARLVKGHVEYRSLGAPPVKGSPQPVAQVELLRRMEASSRWEIRARHGLTRFVGREAELGALDQALALAAESHGQIVGVIGEPGMGKSRLVHEFLSARVSARWTVRVAAASSYGMETPFLPIRHLLRSVVGVAPGDSDALVAEKIEGFVEGLGPHLDSVRPAVRTLAGVPAGDASWAQLDPTQRRRFLIDAFRSVALRRAELSPLLLVFEDLHWLDTETQAALDALTDSIPGARLMLLTTYRPEYEDRWLGKGWHRQVRLSALGASAAAVLVKALLGDDASVWELQSLLAKATEGCPLFVEETVRALADEGRIEGTSAAYRLVEPLGQLGIPDSVQAVIALRIDRLAPETKRVLQTAAVIGRHVPRGLLKTVCGLDPEDLAAQVGLLQAGDFLFERQVLPAIEYAFKHALIESIAYDGPLRSRRTRLHRLVLDAMLSPEETATPDVEALARHAFRSESWQEAVGFLRQAVDGAVGQSAYPEARRHLEHALTAIDRLGDSPAHTAPGLDFHLDMKNVLLAVGELSAIAPHLLEAERLATSLGDRRRHSRVRYHLCHHFWMTGQHREALDAGERGREIAEAIGDSDLEAETRHRLGSVYHSLGWYRRGIEVLGRDDSATQERTDTPGVPEVFARMFLTWCLAELGELREAVRIAEENLSTAERSGVPWAIIDAAQGIGVAYLGKGMAEEAVPYLEKALRLCETSDLPMLHPWVGTLLGGAHVRCQRVGEALPILERAVKDADRMGALANQPMRMTRLAEAYLCDGRPAEARGAARKALDLARSLSERGHEAWTLSLLAQIAGQDGTPETESIECFYREALELAKELEMRPLIARCERGIADLMASRGDENTAQGHAQRAMGLCEEMGVSWEELEGAAIRRPP